jgi:hypothetical protein
VLVRFPRGYFRFELLFECEIFIGIVTDTYVHFENRLGFSKCMKLGTRIDLLKKNVHFVSLPIYGSLVQYVLDSYQRDT